MLRGWGPGGGSLDTPGRHSGRFLLFLPAHDRSEAGAQDFYRQVLGPILILTALLLALAAVVAAYDYSMIREAMK
jgi:hypothetical protein